jgi:hypothetical protein
MIILNYLNLIKCAAVRLLNRNNRTRNICSNSGRRRPGLPQRLPQHKLRPIYKGNKEGGKSLDVGGKRDGRLLPV